jgi:uncharacterized membrane protein
MNRERSDTVVAWFGALCFFLSAIEYLIPKPLPFLRVGLANLPVMLAIDILPLPAFCALILIKILGQGLIGGTLFSYVALFSAVGTVSSALLMLALRRLFPRSLSYVGLSLAGAFASNAAQLLLARWYLFGESAAYIAPPFFLVGCVTGAALGLFANRYAAKSQWYADVRRGNLEPLLATELAASTAKTETTKHRTTARHGPAWLWRQPAFRLAVGSTLICALLFADLLPQAALFALSLILVIADRGRIRPLPILVTSASVILFNLVVPVGKLLVAPLGLAITQGALETGIKKALALEGMIFFSRWMLKPGANLGGRFGSLITRAFTVLGHLTAGKGRVDPKRLIQSLDDLMYGRDPDPR